LISTEHSLTTDRFHLQRLRRLEWAPIIVLLAGLLATALVTWQLSRSEAEKDGARFLNAVQQRHDNIQDRTNTHIAMLQGVAGYLTANQYVDRGEFQTYAEALELERRHPGVLGIGYSRRLTPDEREAVEIEVRQQGFADFKIWPDGQRDEYHPAIYLEPLNERNRIAIGYDMHTEPVRAAAMERARDTGEPTATGRVTLVQEIDAHKQFGFLIYIPVYNNNSSALGTLAERRAKLRGFAYTPLRAGDFFKGIFGTEKDPLVDFAIYDGAETTPDNLLYHSSLQADNASSRFSAVEAFDVAGRRWTIEYRALPAFEAVSSRELVPAVLASGLCLTLLLAGLSLMQARAQAAQRASSQALQDYREATRRDEKLYRLAIEQVKDYAIFLVSPAGAMASWNDGVEKTLGWREPEFVGQPIEVIFPEEDRASAELELRAARERQVAENDRWQVRKDGTRFWASGTTNALYDERGRFVGYLKVMRDLTESRMHQETIAAHEQQLRLITDTLPVLIAYIDAQQCYRFINRTYQQWFGVSPQSLHGRTVRDLFGAETYERARPYIEQVLAGEPVQYTTRMTLNGVAREVSVTYSPDRARDGRVVGFAAMLEDISARMRAEARAQAILESITDAFYTLDREWRFTYVNQLAVGYLGAERETLLGRSAWELFPTLRDTVLYREFTRAVDEQVPVSFIWRSALFDRWMSVRAYPSEEGLSVYFHDVTEQKRTEDENARHARTLQFIVELNQVTTPLSDPEEITAAAAALLGRHMDVDRCAYAEIEMDEEKFVLSGDYTRGVASIVGRYTLAQFGTELAQSLRAGKAYIQEDIDTLPAESSGAAAFRQSDIRALICVPLHKAGRLVAAMAVHQATPRRWTDEEIDLVHLVAARCWEAIERARVARDLRESEERFRQMANSMPQLAWMAWPDGRVYWYNQRWYDYTGTTFEQMDGEGGWQLVHHPDTWRDVYDRYRSAIASGEPFEMTFPLRGADGRYREFLTRAEALRDASGCIVWWFGTNTDVSGEHEAEARFRAVVEATPEFVKIVAPDGTLEYINHAGLRVLEVGPSESVLGMHMCDLLAPEYRAEWTRNHERICLGERLVWQFEIVGLHGARRWMETHAVPIAMPDGHIGHLGVTRDITDAKRIEIEREKLLMAERAAREEAERVVRMKDEFLATLSHELRTPLSAMLGWAQLLRRRSMSAEDTAAGLEAIERNAKAQQKLIDDLLDMSRIISGKVRLDMQRVHLPEVVDAALDVVRPMAEAKRVALVQTIDRGAPALIGDPGRLQQVLWNLLINAIKFTPSGGKVEVVLRQIDSQLELQVCDTGSGVPKDFLPHMFDRFRQFDSSTTRVHGGLGLGLSIVKSLVELHGGTVAAHSEGVGRGATFTVTLPIAAVEPAPAREPVVNGTLENAIAAIDRNVPTLHGLKVLVVDDEADARALLHRILSEYGAKVLTASNAGDALECLLRERPTIIVSDIGMPHTDGYALIGQIRALPPEFGGRTPAIALTAFARAEDRRRALVAGFQLHLAKPVDPEALVLACARMAEVVGSVAESQESSAESKDS
jgi:PAS domain S-box-containing protein